LASTAGCRVRFEPIDAALVRREQRADFQVRKADVLAAFVEQVVNHPDRFRAEAAVGQPLLFPGEGKTERHEIMGVFRKTGQDGINAGASLALKFNTTLVAGFR